MKELPLTRGKIALVDDDDFATLSAYAWVAINPRGYWYAVRSMRRVDGTGWTSRMLGREILEAPPGLVVDYKNGDTLDNRRDNIRLATRSQDCANAHLRKHSRPGLKGVQRHHGRWRARITVDHEVINLGYFSTPEDAHAAYAESAIRYFGEFARMK